MIDQCNPRFKDEGSTRRKLFATSPPFPPTDRSVRVARNFGSRVGRNPVPRQRDVSSALSLISAGPVRATDNDYPEDEVYGDSSCG